MIERVARMRICGSEIFPGTRTSIDLPIADLYTHTPMTVPVQVISGKRDGPSMFISAAVHGDEINGVEIIHRLLRMKQLNRLRGTLICAPIVNVFGFLNQTRYLPDGRDLNRTFPGSPTGSLTARLANLFIDEIVTKCEYGIDLHTAAAHRWNLPQIRANLDDDKTLDFATTFQAPIVIDSDIRDGSLRQIADELGVTVVVYEGGERLRFNERIIRMGLHGIMSSLRSLGMLPASSRQLELPAPIVSRGTRWERATRSGIHRNRAMPGDRVRKGDKLGTIVDIYGETTAEVIAETDGIVIGTNNLPLVNEGDALFHIARFGNVGDAEGNVETFRRLIDDASEYRTPAHEPPEY